jgi:hypothetical protein
VIVIVRRAFPKQAMEMTEYGKRGKPRIRLSTLPTLFGNPFGITTFPRPRLLAFFKVQEQERPNARPLDFKGVVMEVLGPKCNERSSTLNRHCLHRLTFYLAVRSLVSPLGPPFPRELHTWQRLCFPVGTGRLLGALDSVAAVVAFRV